MFLMISYVVITCRFYNFHFTDGDLGLERLRICRETIVYKQATEL